jgi:hypothetical protein
MLASFRSSVTMNFAGKHREGSDAMRQTHNNADSRLPGGALRCFWSSGASTTTSKRPHSSLCLGPRVPDVRTQLDGLSAVVGIS